eukprot:jgi/Undpi1/7267/HiC_scaffold_22.g09740.m1
MDGALLPFIALVSIRKHITVRAPLAAPCLYYIDENNTNISQDTGAAAKAKKPVDPTKSVLRLPTPATLRKETDATADEIDNSNPNAARKYGKAKAKKLYAMVDADWHDGYEDKTDECFNYFKGFDKFVCAAFSLAVQRGTAFERCHDVMRELADSWENMKSIPTRFDIEELFQEADIETCKVTVDGLEAPLKFFSPMDFFSEFWPIFLWAAASNQEISDELLYRWILDADDYGAALPDGNGNSDWVLGVDEVKDASGAVEREATPGLRTTKRRARIFCVVFFVL